MVYGKSRIILEIAMETAHPGNRPLSKDEFLVAVRKLLLDNGWRRLFTENLSLSRCLDDILESLHRDFQPLENGSWQASPKWTYLFRWTCCPLDGIRAVVLANRPLDKNLYSFESTGFALGCKPKAAGAIFDLSRNPAVVNFLKILCQAMEIPFDKTGMGDRFRAGFNPAALSRKGILFLNVALTMGPGRVHDVDRWWPFSEEVLRIVSNRAIDDVPIIQLYRNDQLDHFMEWEERRGQRLVLVGPRPWAGKQHVAFFSPGDVVIHAEALRRCTYQALDVAKRQLEDDARRPNGATERLWLEYMRLERRLEPIQWLEEWIRTGI